MSKITVDCNVSANFKMLKTMQCLENLSNDRHSRVIRIGGDERLFDGSKDNIHSLQATATGIEFECNDSGYPTVMGILKHLEKLSADHTSRVIRMGGDERPFDGIVDQISAITVDGTLNTDAYVSAGRLKNRSRGASRPRNPSKPTPKGTTTSSPNKGQNNLSDSDVDVIKSVITDKVNGREMFTAFDITKKVRSDGMRAFHNDVKSVVADMHQTMANLGYTRTPMSIFNGKTAMVYHRIGDDPNNYANVNQSQPV